MMGSDFLKFAAVPDETAGIYVHPHPPTVYSEQCVAPWIATVSWFVTWPTRVLAIAQYKQYLKGSIKQHNQLIIGGLTLYTSNPSTC